MQRQNKIQLVVLDDLYDVSRTLLVKKGSIINYELIERLIYCGEKRKKKYLVFSDTKLFKNFSYTFNEERYFSIFTPSSSNEQIADIVKKTKITEGVLDELTFMKENLPYTFRHTLSVVALTIKLALNMKNQNYDLQHVALVGLTHDIGKCRIPKEILGKTTPLKQSEYNFLKTHSLLSYLLICYYLGSAHAEVLEAVRDHHEKMDGGGYPRGIKTIGKYATLLAPVDIFDALISERPYRISPFTTRTALDYLISESNTGRIDRDIVYHLISFIRKEHPRSDELKLSSEKRTLRKRSDSCYGKIIPDD